MVLGSTIPLCVGVRTASALRFRGSTTLSRRAYADKADGMPEHQDVWFATLDHKLIAPSKLMKLAENMPNYHLLAGQYFHAFDWEPAEVVIIPLNGEDGRKFFQSIDHLQLTDITGVNDQVNSLKDQGNRFVEQPMSIR